MPQPSSKDFSRSNPHNKPSRIKAWHIVLLVFIAALAAAGTIFVMKYLLQTKPTSDAGHNDIGLEGVGDAAESEPASEPVVPSFINLQPTVDEWAASAQSAGVDLGLEIYDLDNHQIAGSFHPDEVFNIASIYKLFFVYSSARAIENGELNADSYFITTQDYRAGSYTLSECLDLMIRESYNGCADPMRSSSTHSALAQALIDELGLTNTTSLALYSTASDLTALLIKFYEQFDSTTPIWTTITDAMLNQPPTLVATNTTYDWRQGLPAGFSESVKVYNKVGWAWDGSSWDVYADAAIVEFPEQNRHYAVVLLTSGIKTHTPTIIRQFSQLLENQISNSNM